MKISELVLRLETLKSEKGDIEVDYQCMEFGPTSVDYVSTFLPYYDKSETRVLLS